MEKKETKHLLELLKEKDTYLQKLELDLADTTEELLSQKEELTAAIEELLAKNQSLSQAMNQLRDRNFELDQILYRTSHDLRAPLSSIKGVLNLFKVEFQSEAIKEYVAHIEKQADQMDGQLHSLSSLSKAILEEPTVSTIHLNGIIWQVTEALKYLPSWHHVEVRSNLQEERIKTDAFLIIIILQSLLSNAFIFRDPLKTGTISVNSFRKNTDWVLEVTDDGEGVVPGVRDHIFEMFYRGSERSLGNGLGLYVARKAAERLKGTISADFKEGYTRFTVALPLLY